MNLLDNGDGTSTDVDTGDLYDSSSGSIVNAVPNANIFDFQNSSATVGNGLIDSTGGDDVPAGSMPVNNGGGFFDVVNNLLGSVENTFNNLAPTLQTAGVIQSPEARAQQAAYNAQQAARQVQLQQAQLQLGTATQTAKTSSNNLVIYAVIALAAIYILKKV